MVDSQFCKRGKIKLVSLRQLAESRIVIDQEICSGKPRVKGTRVTVSDILLSVAEGMTYTEILRNFRGLQPDDVKAALAYAFFTTDGVKLQIPSAFDGTNGNSNLPATLDTVADEDNRKFSKALEEQASIQEEITKEKLAEIKAQKQKKTISPKEIEIDEKNPAPKERAYDLLIDISGEPSTKIFKDNDNFEQGLDMSLDNYLFELRKDAKAWLCYSTNDGIEIDQAMRRNLLVTYSDSGIIKKAIFEGYLTTDRLHKIFIQRDNGKTCGKAL